MHKISRKKKNICAYPTLKVSDLLPETHLFLYLVLRKEEKEIRK